MLGTTEPDYLFPWVVHLDGCHASLITPRWVLTAAHCVVGTTWSGVLQHTRTRPDGTVVMQSRTISTNSDVFVAPTFDEAPSVIHDIALLRVSQPFDLDDLTQPAHLPFAAPTTGQTGVTASSVFHRVGDFDGDPDGDQDVMAIWNDGGTTKVTVRRADGAAFAMVHWAIPVSAWAPSAQWLPGDFDNDGRTDLARVWNDGGLVTVTVYRSTGSGFDPPRAWKTRDGGWITTAKWNVGDFNNDGRTDLLAIWNSGGQNILTVRRSLRTKAAGDTFVAEHWLTSGGGSWNSTVQWLTGNFDGSGGTDVVSAADVGGVATLTMYRSTGSTFQPLGAWLASGGWPTNVRWRAGDYDADGRDDVLAAWNDGGMSTLTVRRSTGTSFAGPDHWAARRTTWQDSTIWCSGTFDPQ